MPHSWTRHVQVAVSEDGEGWNYYFMSAAQGRVIARNFANAWWCDPRPPVESESGHLTMDNLRRVLTRAVQRVDDCEHRLGEALLEDRKAIARFRHAIEQTEEVGRG
jgi:hypothetical protein